MEEPLRMVWVADSRILRTMTSCWTKPCCVKKQSITMLNKNGGALRRILAGAMVCYLIFGNIMVAANTQNPRTANFDFEWKFVKADVPGAQTVAADDSRWSGAQLPHDWSIEGPKSQNNPAGERGGFLPGGIGWYRKYFQLPEALDSPGRPAHDQRPPRHVFSMFLSRALASARCSGVSLSYTRPARVAASALSWRVAGCPRRSQASYIRCIDSSFS